MDVESLGARICILGPSNSGKSTLAAAIGRARALPVVHLDLLRHEPGTHWIERPDEEFAALHDAAVAEERWVIEGNYSRWMPSRLERATGLILLHASVPTTLRRYVIRTLAGGERAGGLAGVRDRLSTRMIRFIVGPARHNRSRYDRIYDGFPSVKLDLPDRRRLEQFYRENGLARH